MDHANNWQHTSIYPAFVLSGLVDLVAALLAPLPAGASQAVLGCAFGIMALLMNTHEKHEPQVGVGKGACRGACRGMQRVPHLSLHPADHATPGAADPP